MVANAPGIGRIGHEPGELAIRDGRADQRAADHEECKQVRRAREGRGGAGGEQDRDPERQRGGGLDLQESEQARLKTRTPVAAKAGIACILRPVQDPRAKMQAQADCP